MVMTLRHDGAAGTGFLARTDLGALIEALHDDGRTVIGPTVQDGAIVYDEIARPPTCRSAGATSRRPAATGSHRRDGERAFGYAVGPTSWKRYTFPSRVPIGRARRGRRPVDVRARRAGARRPLAFLGVRALRAGRAARSRTASCSAGPSPTPTTRPAARAALVVAVECATAGVRPASARRWAPGPR